MDLDAYSDAHRDEWERLAALARRRRLSGVEADELIERYQSAAGQLSAIKATAGRTLHGDRLSLTLSHARLRFTGARANVLQQLAVFFVVQLPAALHRVRWLTLAVAAAVVALAALTAVWFTLNPEALASLGPYEQLRSYAERDFVGYYSDRAEASFGAQVWTNNAFIAAQCIAFGITGVWVPYVLFQNAQALGSAAAIMNEFDRLDHFFLYIAPHGQLELYAVFTAGAAGLMIFWAWVAPGARTRAQALAEDGRALFGIVIGLIIALLVSGVIEGWVTRQDWPWPVKIGIGTIALAGFCWYQWVWGAKARRAGETGDLGEFDRGARTIVAG